MTRSLVQSGTWINSTVSGSSLTQDLVTTVDLSQCAWTMGGKVTGFKSVTGQNENVGLTVSVRQAEFVVVPEPDHLACVAAAAAICGAWRLRRFRRRPAAGV